MKKVIGVIISVMILLNLTLPGFAESRAASAQKAQTDIIETYIELYESVGCDKETAMAQLMREYPSLEIIDSSITYFSEDGTEIVPTKSSMRDINFIDEELVHDSDWDTYIYFGSWNWETFPDDEVLQPDDVVGFYTQDPECMFPLAYFVYGYNKYNQRSAYYNSDTGDVSGYIAKGEDTSWGAGFWVDESEVRKGEFIVPVDFARGENKRVMLKYDHSWLETYVTGVGGEIHITGGGFNVSWDSEVRHWPSATTSPGVSLP